MVRCTGRTLLHCRVRDNQTGGTPALQRSALLASQSVLSRRCSGSVVVRSLIHIKPWSELSIPAHPTSASRLLKKLIAGAIFLKEARGRRLLRSERRRTRGSGDYFASFFEAPGGVISSLPEFWGCERGCRRSRSIRRTTPRGFGLDGVSCAERRRS